MPRGRPHSRYTVEAAQLLGAQIQAARRERRWSQAELAGRAGITKPTLSKVERGDLGVAIGTVFEVATLVGVPLFHEDRSRLTLDLDRTTGRSALLPQRVRAPSETSTMTSSAPDEAFVWVWLPGATEPVVAGRLAPIGDLIEFNYGRSYLERNDAIPIYLPELPLRRGVIAPLDGLRMAGAINDAGPDAWGQRVIMQHVLGAGASDADPADLHPLTYLLASGSDRIGALDFQESADAYVSRDDGIAPLEELLQAADRVDQRLPLPPALDRALLHGSSIGGARPKALLSERKRRLIAKFSSTTDSFLVVKGEFVAMDLARRAGLDVARVELVESMGKDVLLVERFDRSRARARAARWCRR